MKTIYSYFNYCIMSVRLLSYSRDGEKNIQELVCYCARVSNPLILDNSLSKSKNENSLDVFFAIIPLIFNTIQSRKRSVSRLLKSLG